MQGRMPPLDREAIRSLFEVVDDLSGASRPGVPMAELLGLPASLAGGVVLTVDFALARELGRECIVLQVPMPAVTSPDPVLAALTPREAEVATMIAAGLANKQIAARLGVSLATIKSHVHHILTKLGLPNRAAIAAVVGPPGSPLTGDAP